MRANASLNGQVATDGEPLQDDIVYRRAEGDGCFGALKPSIHSPPCALVSVFRHSIDLTEHSVLES